jgi:hypothetical protein
MGALCTQTGESELVKHIENFFFDEILFWD